MLNVLIIDDHQLIVDAYKTALKQITLNNDNLKFNINEAHDCDSANLKIEEAKKNLPFDLVLLDISLPPSQKRDFLSGEDIGVKLKTVFKNVKLIVITSYKDNYRLYNLFTNLNPEGFLVKNDISMQNLIESINSILNDIPYYSKTITKLLRQHISNDFVLDKIDRQILYHLSMGMRIKDLSKVIPLSNPALEKRKRALIEVFNIKKMDDRTLIRSAKENGFL